MLCSGKVAGVPARRDLVRVFIRGDADLVHEVGDRVLREQLDFGPGRVRLEVRAGVVTVVDRVGRCSDIDPREAAGPRAVRRGRGPRGAVSGVVPVLVLD